MSAYTDLGVSPIVSSRLKVTHAMQEQEVTGNQQRLIKEKPKNLLRER